MEEGNTKELNIFNPETNTTYTLFVSEEDYARAQKDDYFVSALLNNATNEVSKEETQTQPNNNSITASTSSDVLSSNTVPVPHIWQYSETLALIKSMQVHIDELNHPKKKKYVYDNCVNDLLSEGFAVTATQCQIKWKSLIRSYHSAKDNQTKTGRGPSRFQFFEEIDAILGTKPSNQCGHSIESSIDSNSNIDKETSLNETTLNCEEENTPDDAPIVKSDKGKKRKISEQKIYSEEQKNKRHAERMEVERQKIANDKEKIDLLKAYLERKT